MGKRISLWDNLKLFLIFLVVLGHLTLQYFNSSTMFCTMTMVIYTFHMPAFVFVSGLFSKHSINSDKAPIKKSFSFLMLYFFARILNYFSNIIFGVHSYFDIFSAKDVPWYMMAMALWYLIVWALRKVDTKYVFVTSVVIACFAGYMKGETDFLCILRLVTFFPFFYAGYVLDADKINEVTSKKSAKIFSAVYFALFVLIVTLTNDDNKNLFPLLSGRRKYFALDDNIEDFGALLRFAYFVVVSLLIFSIISLCPRKELKTTKYGSKTLQIYVYHRPLLYIMKNAGLFYLIRKIGPGWEWVALALIILLTALLCLNFWQKPLDYIMNPKLKGENYVSSK